jgi:hypothetical protein
MRQGGLPEAVIAQEWFERDGSYSCGNANEGDTREWE